MFAELQQACGGDLRRLIAAVKSVVAAEFSTSLQEDLHPALAPAAGRCRAGKEGDGEGRALRS